MNKRKIYVSIDTQYGHRTAGDAKYIHDLIKKDAEDVFGSVCESSWGPDEGFFFGMHNTWYVVPWVNIIDGKKEVFWKKISKVYDQNTHILRGMKIDWEGDKLDKKIKDLEERIKKEGKVTFRLGDF